MNPHPSRRDLLPLLAMASGFVRGSGHDHDCLLLGFALLEDSLVRFTHREV